MHQFMADNLRAIGTLPLVRSRPQGWTRKNVRANDCATRHAVFRAGANREITRMSERPRFFDDLAGVAGGAFSALNGMREEIHSVVRSRINEVLASLDLVRREELDVVRDMAATARVSQEAAEARLSTLEHRIHELETHRASEHGSEKGHNQHKSGDHA